MRRSVGPVLYCTARNESAAPTPRRSGPMLHVRALSSAPAALRVRILESIALRRPGTHRRVEHAARCTTHPSPRHGAPLPHPSSLLLTF